MNEASLSGQVRSSYRVDRIAEEVLDTVRERGTYRRMRVVSLIHGRQLQVDGRPAVNFASSNYLDLAHHPDVVNASAEVARSHGCASGGSRLICGNTELHEALEAELAAFLGTEAALVFSSGYLANLGVLSALLRPADIVLSDALNHASLVDGCRLARADVRVFPHGDVDALATALEVAAGQAAREGRRVLLVLDGVYSMDGDLAPLAAMARLGAKHGAIVLLDDAHGCGTLGPRGRGSAELLGVEHLVDVYIGALGKALGSFGAFVAGSARLRELLVNTARTFLFTCALSAPQVAAARTALRIVQAEPERRERLQGNAARLRARLASHGIATAPSTTHIIPVIVGENAATMLLSERLIDLGYFAKGIRHPSVPRGTSRLRLTVMATHEADEIDALADAIAHETRVGHRATPK